MSIVYYATSRSPKWSKLYSLPFKLEEILYRLNLNERISPGDYVAVKMHLGSPGAFRIVRPYFIKLIVDAIKRAGGKPFIAETVREPALSYLELANMNGISYGTVGAPVIIADGIKGADGVVVKAGETLEKIAVASAIYDADAMVVVSHVKGHVLSAFGGAIKNVAMGCVCHKHRSGDTKVSRGRLHIKEQRDMHYDHKLCSLCLNCLEVCPTDSLYQKGDKIIRRDTCNFCMRCERVCPTGAMSGSLSQEEFQKSLADATKAVLSTFDKGKVLNVNFNLEIQPECDCMPTCDNPTVQDSGIFASDDIVAVDRASYEDIRTSAPLPNSAASDLDLKPGDDIFKGLFPKSDSTILFDELEKLGLGSNKYDLVEIEHKKD